MGMFYKRRDYSPVVNGKHPIVAHEFLGDSVEGKDVVIIDDMIASGESMLDVAKQIKERKAKRVFICTTYGLFTEGLAKFDEYYEKGWIDRVITTNLIYRLPQLLTKEYYIEANMSKYLASIIDTVSYTHLLSIGVSNFEIRHLEELRRVSGIVPAVNQIECHPLCYPKELIEYCQANDIQVQAYAPLARGAYLDNDVLCVPVSYTHLRRSCNEFCMEAFAQRS